MMRPLDLLFLSAATFALLSCTSSSSAVTEVQEGPYNHGDHTGMLPASEPSGLEHPVLDTYFRNGQAIIVWNSALAGQWRDAL